MGSADRSPHGDDDGDDRRSEPRPVPECDGAAVDLLPFTPGAGRNRRIRTPATSERERRVKGTARRKVG